MYELFHFQFLLEINYNNNEYRQIDNNLTTNNNNKNDMYNDKNNNNNNDNDNKNIDVGNYDIFIINQMLQFKKKKNKK